VLWSVGAHRLPGVVPATLPGGRHVVHVVQGVDLGVCAPLGHSWCSAWNDACGLLAVPLARRSGVCEALNMPSSTKTSSSVLIVLRMAGVASSQGLLGAAGRQMFVTEERLRVEQYAFNGALCVPPSRDSMDCVIKGLA